jgi:GAF domain-containing protein
MRYDVVAIVASARGLTPLRRLLQRLPRDLPVPVVCLSQADPALATRLSAESGLDVRWANASEPIEPGRVYLSPPGGTMLLLDGSVTVAPYGPESTSLHPQDRFLESVAARYGSRALCIVLGSFEEDGVQGACAVKQKGGTVLVLDRATAAYWGMAEPILRAGQCDRVLAAEEVAESLRAWFTQRDILECAELQFELQQLLDSALRMTGTRMGDMQLFDAREQALRVIVHRGFDKRVLDEMACISASDEHPCARALRYRQRVVIEDVDSDPQFVPYLPLSAAAGFRAVQSTPIFAPDSTEIGGIFSTHYPYPHHVNAEEARVLDDIAREARPFVARFQREAG